MAVAARKYQVVINEVTLSQADVAAGFIFLPLVPSPTTLVALDVVGCGAQSPNVDYVLNDAGRLLWNAMGLETLLSPGVKLRITYYL
jgi:hypothetical protein